MHSPTALTCSSCWCQGWIVSGDKICWAGWWLVSHSPFLQLWSIYVNTQGTDNTQHTLITCQADATCTWDLQSTSKCTQDLLNIKICANVHAVACMIWCFTGLALRHFMITLVLLVLLLTKWSWCLYAGICDIVSQPVIYQHDCESWCGRDNCLPCSVLES